jgi:hypothetical protein
MQQLQNMNYRQKKDDGAIDEKKKKLWGARFANHWLSQRQRAACAVRGHELPNAVAAQKAAAVTVTVEDAEHAAWLLAASNEAPKQFL